MSYLTGSYMGLYYNIIIDRYSNPEFSVVLNLHPDLHGLHSESFSWNLKSGLSENKDQILVEQFSWRETQSSYYSKQRREAIFNHKGVISAFISKFTIHAYGLNLTTPMLKRLSCIFELQIVKQPQNNVNMGMVKLLKYNLNIFFGFS